MMMRRRPMKTEEGEQHIMEANDNRAKMGREKKKEKEKRFVGKGGGDEKRV